MKKALSYFAWRSAKPRSLKVLDAKVSWPLGALQHDFYIRGEISLGRGEGGSDWRIVVSKS